MAAPAPQRPPRRGYVPRSDGIVWANFSPQVGHEQAGHRPALVLSATAYNRISGTMLCVPLTTRAKGYRFEVPIAGDPASVALADAARSLDWRARGARWRGARAAPAEADEVRARLRALLAGDREDES